MRAERRLQFSMKTLLWLVVLVALVLCLAQEHRKRIRAEELVRELTPLAEEGKQALIDKLMKRIDDSVITHIPPELASPISTPAPNEP